METVLSQQVDGLVRIGPNPIWQRNLLVYEWGAVVARALAEGLPIYRIAAMYVEFVNVATPGDAISIPALDRTRSLDYYTGLQHSPDRDYMRVDMQSSSVFSSDEELFPKGNAVTFSARTNTGIGVWGKQFSYAANSVIVGGALVAKVNPIDPTQDLLFSAWYLTALTQQPVAASGQHAIDWVKAFN